MITLTQKLTLALDIQAHDENGNPALVFANGDQPTNIYQMAIAGSLTEEFVLAAIEQLQKARAELQVKVNPPAEKDNDTSSPRIKESP